MSEDELRKLLSDEILAWSRKSLAFLEMELVKKRITFDRGEGENWHQFEVNLLENSEEYIHISIAVDDGSYEFSRFPVSSSFIVHRNGRVEI
ncbi:MAG: hypothetical protein ABL893_16210 [Hyphomicrobium sp.]